jgi:hypothetical protein
MQRFENGYEKFWWWEAPRPDLWELSAAEAKLAQPIGPPQGTSYRPMEDKNPTLYERFVSLGKAVGKHMSVSNRQMHYSEELQSVMAEGQWWQRKSGYDLRTLEENYEGGFGYSGDSWSLYVGFLSEFQKAATAFVKEFGPLRHGLVAEVDLCELARESYLLWYSSSYFEQIKTELEDDDEHKDVDGTEVVRYFERDKTDKPGHVVQEEALRFLERVRDDLAKEGKDFNSKDGNRELAERFAKRYGYTYDFLDRRFEFTLDLQTEIQEKLKGVRLVVGFGPFLTPILRYECKDLICAAWLQWWFAKAKGQRLTARQACGGILFAKRSNQLYHDNRCRQAASYRRTKEEEQTQSKSN